MCVGTNFWFLGHPEVYIILLPALGITSEVISTNSRKPIFGYRAMIGSIMAIAFLSTIVWGHHMFVTGMNPFLGSVFTFTTLLIAIPSAVKAFNYITTLWKGNLQLNPAMLFSIGMVSFVTLPEINIRFSWPLAKKQVKRKLSRGNLFIIQRNDSEFKININLVIMFC